MSVKWKWIGLKRPRPPCLGPEDILCPLYFSYLYGKYSNYKVTVFLLSGSPGFLCNVSRKKTASNTPRACMVRPFPDLPLTGLSPELVFFTILYS